MGHNEFVLGVHRRLDVVADLGAHGLLHQP